MEPDGQEPNGDGPPPRADDALDAYSAVVVRVAATVGPSVASVTVKSRRGAGAGSASVLTSDGFLLTSAHVVQGAEHAGVTFSDGTGTDAGRHWP